MISRGATVVPEPGTLPRPQIPLLLGAVFLVFLGQMSLNPIIAPLSRQIGLAEWQVGVMISVSALMMVVTSQMWGRRSQSWGRKPVLVAALALATTTTALFALLADLGMRGIVTGTALFLLFVVFRGVGFGTAIAAVAPTAQAYIADVTPDPAARVRGMAGIGAVQGVAMVAGALVGGLLAGFGLMAPLLAVPALLAVGLTAVAVRLRRQTRTELIAAPARISPWDARVWPYLLTGLGMFTALGFVQVVSGFLVQDRFGLDAETTGLLTGGALLAAGAGMVFAQTVVVPRSGWRPALLLRVGCLVALIGFVLLVPDTHRAVLIAAMALIGLGLGVAMPGYVAGPTLAVDRNEQGGLAGLIGVTNGLTFVLAPTASTALYAVWAPLPVLVGAVLMAAVSTFVLTYPGFRRGRAGVPQPVGRPVG
ncbi:MFS transporter [Solwaraspora sp. WMMD791]|uniref:MFS transporter n=1 Tax=Solwaraspora sp. WMMD791 TaxID=3016086 RepID=UPI00249CADA9|nr:MFS transporter [Solwaraspora sp. WMMD791]WFE29155.1 MFS transporter [Solwaraspora sp. WMMD791]